MSEGQTGAAKHHASEAEKMLIEDGASLSQLGRIFRKDKRTISVALRGLKPSGERMGYPIYNIGEAAARLATPDEGRVVETIKRMKPSQLPIKIQKEFWDAARSRQKYLEDQHELWRTRDLVDALLEVFKSFKQGCLLMADAVERETDLSPRQRDIVNELTDALLVGVQKSLFENPKFTEITNVYDRDHDQTDDLEKLFDAIELTDEDFEFDDEQFFD
jgi:hypothetical protein